MSFEPIQTDGRRSLGVRLGYTIRKANASAGARMRFSFSPEYVTKMKWQDGEFLRLDVDSRSRQARFVSVLAMGKAARRLEIRTRTTGRGHWELPWTGDVPSFFPIVNEMTELTLVELKSGDGLVFELPNRELESEVVK